MGELSRHERVHALMAGELERVNARYAHVEQAKRAVILDHDRAQEGGELNPT